MTILPCRCGAPANKIVVDTIESTMSFAKKRTIMCTACGNAVNGWVVPENGEATAEEKWNDKNSVADVVTSAPAQAPETCATCRFWMEDITTMRVPNRGKYGACHRYPMNVQYIPRNTEDGIEYDSQRIQSWPDMPENDWCGEYKAVKS